MSDVSLREHLEAQIAHEREVRQLAEANSQMALRLQATEYERRLELLNNSAQVLKDAVAQNVSADTWVGFSERYEADQQRKSERFGRIERFQNKILGAFGLAILFVPAVTGVVVGLVVYVLTRHAVPVQTTTP